MQVNMYGLMHTVAHRMALAGIGKDNILEVVGETITVAQEQYLDGQRAKLGFLREQELDLLSQSLI